MSRSDEYMLTAEEIRLKRRKHRRVLLILILLLILLAGCFFTARPARDSIKAWQARRHATKAFAFIEQQKWTDAKNAAIAAYQLRPTEPQALRAVARFLSRTRQPDALDFWKQLAAREALSRGDRRDEAAVAIGAGETTRADEAVRELITSKAKPIDWLLASQLAIQKGVAEDAFAALDKVFADSRSTEEQLFQAALLEQTVARATEGATERLNDAWSRLQKLAQGQSEVALNSLAVLVQQLITNPRDAPHPFAMTTEEIRRRLEEHPLAKAPHKLLAFDLIERMDPNRREELIGHAIEEWKNADAAALLALATWLHVKGEFQRQIDTIPLEKALQTRELFMRHLDALGGLRRWGEIKQVLASERFPLDPVAQLMYLARCNTQLGEKTAAENNWQRALEAAGGDAGKLIMVAEYAEKNGLLSVADSAHSAAVREAPKLRGAQQGRLRMAQRSGETKRIHGVLAEMLRLWPHDAAIQNDEAYLRLLLLGSNRRNDENRMTNDERQKSDGNSELPASNSQLPAPSSPPSEPPTPNSQLPAPTTNPPQARGQTEAEETEAVPSGSNAQRSTPNKGQSGSDQLSTSEDLTVIEQLAEQLVQRNPRSLPHRTLLALVRLRQNRPAEALAVYDNVQVAPGALSPTALVVHAAVLAANGNLNDAKTEVAQIPIDRLLPEEKALIEKVTSDE